MKQYCGYPFEKKVTNKARLSLEQTSTRTLTKKIVFIKRITFLLCMAQNTILELCPLLVVLWLPNPTHMIQTDRSEAFF